MKILVAIASLALALLLFGCGNSNDPETSSGALQETTVLESPPDPQREAATEAWVREAIAAGKPDPRWRQLQKAAGPLADRLIFPHGPPPKEVVVRDLQPGKGQMLEPGDSFGVDYSSYSYQTGARTQNNSTDDAPLYHYGTRETVKAWDPGLKEMRVGGVRELIVPSKWGYGSEPLVYLIKLTVVLS